MAKEYGLEATQHGAGQPRRIHVALVAQFFSSSLWSHDCSSPGSSVLGIFQARILEWVAIPFSRGSSQPRDQNPGLPHCRQILYHLGQWIYWSPAKKVLLCTAWYLSVRVKGLSWNQVHLLCPAYPHTTCKLGLPECSLNPTSVCGWWNQVTGAVSSDFYSSVTCPDSTHYWPDDFCRNYCLWPAIFVLTSPKWILWLH